MSPKRKVRTGQRRGGQGAVVQGNSLRLNRNTSLWGELDELKAQTLAANTSAGCVLEWIKNREASMQVVDKTTLNTMVTSYLTTVRQMKERRAEIFQRIDAFRATNPRSGPDTLIQILDYGQEVVNWLQDFAQRVLFQADQILDHYRSLGYEISYYSPYSIGWQEAAIREFGTQADPNAPKTVPDFVEAVDLVIDGQQPQPAPVQG